MIADAADFVIKKWRLLIYGCALMKKCKSLFEIGLFELF